MMTPHTSAFRLYKYKHNAVCFHINLPPNMKQAFCTSSTFNIVKYSGTLNFTLNENLIFNKILFKVLGIQYSKHRNSQAVAMLHR